MKTSVHLGNAAICSGVNSGLLCAKAAPSASNIAAVANSSAWNLIFIVISPLNSTLPASILYRTPKECQNPRPTQGTRREQEGVRRHRLVLGHRRGADA